MLSLPFLVKPFDQNIFRHSFAILESTLKGVGCPKEESGSHCSFTARRNVKLILCFSSLLSMLSYAEESKEVVVEMESVENFSRERCIEVAAGAKVSYRFESRQPIDFNIHYHTEKHTGFLINKKQITSIANEFSTKTKQEYCFTWVNKKEPGDSWNFVFSYKITP